MDETRIPQPHRVEYCDILRDGGSYELGFVTETDERYMVRIRVIKDRKFKTVGYKPPVLKRAELDQPLGDDQSLSWDEAEPLLAALRPLSGGPFEIGTPERAREMFEHWKRRGRA